MKKLSLNPRVLVSLGVMSALLQTGDAFAHCDGLDGPVVKAARRALAETNVCLALVWVQKTEEAEVKQAFEKTLKVRALGPDAKELADHYFFETIVRLHRAGEGAPYTGLKPAGRDLGPAIPAADSALETGKLDPLADLLSHEMRQRLLRHFHETRAKKNFVSQDVEAGRAYVKAYVSYIHFVEGMFQIASGASLHHPGEEGAAEAH